MPGDKVINIKTSKIYCDAEGCDYVSEPVDSLTAMQYVDKPCPKCGNNLLTMADYGIMKRFLDLVETLNEMLTIAAEDRQVPKIKIDATAKDGRLEIRGGL